MPTKEAALLGSILLGDDVSPLPEELKDDYRRAGLIHLLVVSGTQVSILIGLCSNFTKIAGFPVWLAFIFTSGLNLFLIVVTGAGASILRAGIMAEAVLIAKLLERDSEIINSLSLAALILLVASPASLFDLGFQLSFAATWSLAYLAPLLGKRLPQLVACSLAPLLATSPIIAFNFGQVTPGALAANLLVLPWIELLVIMGCLTALLGWVFLPLAKIIGGTIWLLLVTLNSVADFVGQLPGACFYIKAPGLPLLVGYYIVLVIMAELLRRDAPFKVTGKRLVFALLLIVSVFLWNSNAAATTFGSREMTVSFIDVGQGDSALIETPDGKKILVDGGGDEGGKVERSIGRRVILPFLRRKGVNKLDLVVLTHPHADHLGGLLPVLEEMPVDKVLDSGQVYDSQAYRRFKALIEANKIKLVTAQAGQVINFGAGISAEILNPLQPYLDDTNSDSVVMRLVYNNVSFMLTGDLEKNGEERVLQSAVSNLRSTILKVGHHGSRTSTSDEFLALVSPEAAVISCGTRNRYRHPHQVTLEKLLAAGSKIYRTDINGTVMVRTDGSSYVIETRE